MSAQSKRVMNRAKSMWKAGGKRQPLSSYLKRAWAAEPKRKGSKRKVGASRKKVSYEYVTTKKKKVGSGTPTAIDINNPRPRRVVSGSTLTTASLKSEIRKRLEEDLGATLVRQYKARTKRDKKKIGKRATALKSEIRRFS